MKVMVRLLDVEAAVPELVPAIRSLGNSLPDSVEIEALPTVEAQREKDLRDMFPDYWSNFTMTEWILFVHLFDKRDCSRKELKNIMHGDYVGSDDRGYHLSNVVDVHVKNLRIKLRMSGNRHHILTKRAWGYEFRDGADPVERTSGLHLFGAPKRIETKLLNEDGSLRQKKHRRSATVLNSVEFGYLKEMKMDEISKEEAGKVLGLEGKTLDWAWEAPDYDRYTSATFLKARKTSWDTR